MRKLILVLMMLWLPLQSGAALASCLLASFAPKHSSVPSAVSLADGHSHAGSQQVTPVPIGAYYAQAPVATDDDPTHHVTTDADCERCTLCQFVHGGVVLSAASHLPSLQPSVDFHRMADERFTAHVPDPLQRPPQAIA